MNAPDDDNRAPCHQNLDHIRTDVHSHTAAKALCAGCPFDAWCFKEREAAAALNGRLSINGTWHGALWVNGVRWDVPSPGKGRPRKTRTAA